MDETRSQQSNGSPLIFLAGVVIGGIGGAIAGWLLGGHITPLLASVPNLISRNDKRQTVRFEALQQ